MKEFRLNIEQKELKVKIENLAEQANGSCSVQCGQTLVLSTVVMGQEREGTDYFPLTVDYQERYYAAGKILGSRYIRRESRPSDEAILTSRLIDRAIRPRFPKNFKREVQVIVTCLSWDRENDPDILGLLASSISLLISDIPWQGPVAPLRISQKNGKFILNPTYQEREDSNLDLVISGLLSENDEFLVNMLEGEGQEVKEEIILEAIDFAKPYLEKLINFQKEIQKELGKEKIEIESKNENLEIQEAVKNFLSEKLKGISQLKKGELGEIEKELLSFIKEKYKEQEDSLVREFFNQEIDKWIHENIIKKELRPDGRKLDEIRKIDCQVGLLPRTHGSGFFSRGLTKALSILTLGAPGDVKLLEGMEIIGKKRFMHHYNFPPYSAGEVKPLRGPSRREIGHGMLVEKALFPLIPSFEEFPYTIRIVTEILSSNGSTSMASVCASSLALMDAGVKIKRPAAGIAMGLMSDKEGNYKILTDIQGPEDHHGDMDFKVAGTKEGVTALQLDVKIEGINKKIIAETLERAKKARWEILEKMAKVIEEPRPSLSPFAPRVLTLQINPEKIREVIGPGGRVINAIIAECGVSIDIEESGKIYITAEKEEAAKKALSWIKNITREIKVGEIFQGKVKRILDFGAIIEILPNQEGLLHISQLANRRIKKVSDVVKVGDVIPVKVISIDQNGRINLSLKQIKKDYGKRR